MINSMQSGSIIYDLAAVQGGNTSFTEKDKIVERNGVKIMEILIYLINCQYQHLVYTQKMY